MAHRLDPLLAPRSIALVGASNQAGRIGGMPLDLLRHFEFGGTVYPVNPKYEEVFGYRCYPDIESLPEAPDLVVLAIGAEDVTAMLEHCHAKQIRAAIVYAAGFAEAGAAGAALQADLEAFAARSGMVVAGPNCMGFANLNIQAYTAFAAIFKTVAPQQAPGRVSIVTQSGNVCSALFGLTRQQGVTVSHFINTGNEAVVDFSDYLAYLAQDPSTDCVLGYVEELRNGPLFIDTALRFSAQNKPLILYKAGETERGAAAVQSHTSALAGDMALYRAGFAQLNVIQAQDFAQMADLAMLSGFRQRRGGLRAAVITMSGALGAILADKLIGAGMELPVLPEALQQQLRNGIPDYGMVSNPVDVTGNIVNTPDFVRTVFEALATTDAVDVVVVNAPGYLLDRMADALAEVCARHPRLFVAIDTGAAQSRDKLSAAGVPVFGDIGRAVQALAPWCRWLAQAPASARWAALRNAATTAAAEALPPSLNEHQTKQLLARHGVTAVREQVAADAEAAVAAAQSLGWPVALKILSADIAHKTEVGGVCLNIGDAPSLHAACTAMREQVTRQAPQARIDGFLVQPMARGGVAELIAGVTHDPVFGPALTVGLGGVLTELYRDASHRLLPVDEALVRQMLGELKAWPLLDGFRGRPLGDVDAACASIAGLSSAALALGPQAAEIEINPLLVHPRGQGAWALDALIVQNAESTSAD